MTKTQFWLLNIVSGVLIALLFAHYFASRANSRLAAQLNKERAYIKNADQLQPVLENLVRRIAAAGQNDTKLRSLLTKYDIRFSSGPDMRPSESASESKTPLGTNATPPK